MSKLENKIITIEECVDNDRCVLKSVQSIVSFPLSRKDKATISIIKERCLSMEGVGLSAPQIGINRSIAAIFIPESANLLRDNVVPYPLHIIINAKYEPVIEDGVSEDFEGCYSVSSCMGKVKRFNTIKVTFQIESGEVVERIEKGFYARVLQHEIDHLNGILITDKFGTNSLYGSPAKMAKIRRESLSPEKRGEYDKLLEKKGYKLDCNY